MILYIWRNPPIQMIHICEKWLGKELSGFDGICESAQIWTASKYSKHMVY